MKKVQVSGIYGKFIAQGQKPLYLKMEGERYGDLNFSDFPILKKMKDKGWNYELLTVLVDKGDFPCPNISGVYDSVESVPNADEAPWVPVSELQFC